MNQVFLEDWMSGLNQQFTKLSGRKLPREFESHILRHNMYQLEPKLQFSFNQFFIYDSSVFPGSDWKQDHINQGFVRRENVIAVGTIIGFGEAFVSLFINEGYLDLGKYERVFSIPITIVSGEINIDGPEEHPTDRKIKVESGFYVAEIGQKVIGEYEESIHIYLRKVSSEVVASKILLADDALHPGATLIETGDMV